MVSLLENILNDITVKFTGYIPKLISIAVTLVIGYIIIKVLVRIIEKFFGRINFDRSAETFVENLVKVILWIILIIIILSNLGVNVSGLIAGLGIMGFIVGFALKDTLGNLASGVFILFHKPFKVGDWVKIGDVVGGVERVGISACTLKSPDNVKITIPNSKIWGDVIQNFHGNPTRKLFNLEVGISYDSNIDKAIRIINDILKKDKRVLKDPAPQIVVRSLGDNSVNIAVRPTMKKEDYWDVYFDTIKKVKEEFDKNKITIPFPQRDLWVKEMPKGRKR
ncbi:mechanosensitive ion channel protein MscS [archaeon]|jgi:small conductance mechanosensitive channel|nr:mechanosensitive ion channel protein MscS [archaeon]MDP6547658.1 mechanosensitive ion channel family protein [Candidatus Woesearchaeota archaeon]|tara:strand:- start:15050 stop:15889 length:840 start_codon:yes stop_codon:yes gene_type:complete